MPDPLTNQQVNELMMRFYEHPDPECISALIASTATGEAANVPGIPAFLSSIFDQYPDRVDEWITDAVSFGVHSSEEALLAVSMSNHLRRDELLTALSDKVGLMLGSDDWEAFEEVVEYFGDLRTAPITEPFQLDMSWSAFFASGDIAHVERIVGVLSPKSPRNVDIQGTALRQSAYWSLASIAAEHQLVYQFCQRTLENPDTSPTVREELGSWMKSVTAKRN